MLGTLCLFTFSLFLKLTFRQSEVSIHSSVSASSWKSNAASTTASAPTSTTHKWSLTKGFTKGFTRKQVSPKKSTESTLLFSKEKQTILKACDDFTKQNYDNCMLTNFKKSSLHSVEIWKIFCLSDFTLWSLTTQQKWRSFRFSCWFWNR